MADEIRLQSKFNKIDEVIFRVTPEISEGRSVTFVETSDIRAPGGILIYIGTQPRTYDITAKFVSRTEKEATEAFQYLHLLKSWTMPIEEKTGGWDNGVGGSSTPDVLMLYGYNGGDSSRGQFRGVPVVITSLNLSFPPDINYIQTKHKVFVPIIQNVTIALKEARQFTELQGKSDNDGVGFNLAKYKEGNLDTW